MRDGVAFGSKSRFGQTQGPLGNRRCLRQFALLAQLIDFFFQAFQLLLNRILSGLIALSRLCRKGERKGEEHGADADTWQAKTHGLTSSINRVVPPNLNGAAPRQLSMNPGYPACDCFLNLRQADR